MCSLWAIPRLAITRRTVVDFVLVLLFPIAAKAAIVVYDLPWQNSRTLDYACGYSCAILISLISSTVLFHSLPRTWSNNRRARCLFLIAGTALGGAWYFSVHRPLELQAGKSYVGLQYGQFVIRVSTAQIPLAGGREIIRIGPKLGTGAARSAVGFPDSLSLTMLGLVHAKVMHDKGTHWLSVLMPMWILLLGSWASIVIVVWRQNGKARQQGNLCHVCNYDLTGNESGTCPECGTSIPEEKQRAIAESTST